MVNFWVSPNDPIFFFHHSFVDFLWEFWRQKVQTRFWRENDYPLDFPKNCDGPNFFHLAEAKMNPFFLRNRDGIKNFYTDFFYEFQDRPSCSSNSKIFCDDFSFLFCG